MKIDKNLLINYKEYDCVLTDATGNETGLMKVKAFSKKQAQKKCDELF